VFGTFDKQHSVLLYSSLLLNYKELLETNSAQANYYFLIDESDRDFVTTEFADSARIIWINSHEKISALKNISDKYFINYNNNIIIPSDTMGIYSKDFKKTFNLLAVEDDAIVAGRAYNDKISFIGFNRLDDNFFTDFNWDDLNYLKGLSALCRQNIFLQVIDGCMIIETTEEYRKLYQELSKKESLAYCSQNMHEKFTSLFIEYKELLK
jgi:hypothetical protein